MTNLQILFKPLLPFHWLLRLLPNFQLATSLFCFISLSTLSTNTFATKTVTVAEGTAKIDQVPFFRFLFCCIVYEWFWSYSSIFWNYFSFCQNVYWHSFWSFDWSQVSSEMVKIFYISSQSLVKMHDVIFTWSDQGTAVPGIEALPTWPYTEEFKAILGNLYNRHAQCYLSFHIEHPFACIWPHSFFSMESSCVRVLLRASYD